MSLRALLGFCLIVGATVQARHLPVKVYTTADGLPRNRINNILRDSRGYLGFCTQEGLSRFDGYKFTTYGVEEGLPHRDVTSLLETRSGEYWVGTRRGLCRFYPASGTKFNVLLPSEKPRGQFVTALLEDRAGGVWCGTADGLYRLEGSSFRPVDLDMPEGKDKDDRTVFALREDRRGALWIGAGGGLYRYPPGGRWERFTHLDGLPNASVKALLEDRAGRLWVGTSNGLAQIVSEPKLGEPVVARLYTSESNLPGKWVTALHESSDGRIWVAMFGGLAELASSAGGNGDIAATYTRADGLSEPGIVALADDTEGNLWLGTEAGGAVRIARGGFSGYTEADGLASTRTYAMFHTLSGELCAITSKKGSLVFHRFDGKRFQAVPVRFPANIRYFGWGWRQIALQSKTGEWWIATGEGLLRFPQLNRLDQLARVGPKSVYTSRDGLAGDEVFRLFEDSRGDIWIGTIAPERYGLSRWEQSTGSFYHYSQAELAPLKDRAVYALGEDSSGGVWIGFGDGVARYADGRFRVFTPADGWPGAREFYFDRTGRLWFAAPSGLGRVDSPASARPQLRLYTSAQGLSSNLVIGITEDQWGRIYFGTARGIDRLEPDSGRIKQYTTADGLPAGSEVGIAFRDREGSLWFSAQHQALVRLDPEADRARAAPPVLISGIRIRGVARALSDLGEANVSGLSLQPDQNQIQIDFLGFGFGLGEQLHYQYMLEGADKDWSPPGDQRTVNYAHLKAGAYRFLVRAINSDGLASPQAATVQFAIAPPLWQRWWALLLACAAMSAATYGVYRYRVARAIELERLRTRIATDLHDDIGASLSHIAILSEVTRQRLAVSDRQLGEPLSRISQVSRELVDSMGDIVWATNPSWDRLADLVYRMRRFAGELFEARDIEFEFHTPAEQDLPLAPEVRRQVFLIFKESINNLVRHSGCTRASIELAIENGNLVLALSDNGSGFRPGQPDIGNGLASMRERAGSLGGAIEFSTGHGQGALVKLTMPLRPRTRAAYSPK
jgi:ligand-binding sensor domain-containing protein/signal transduction histidine kinase